jgi:hypothetical protein
MTYQQNEIWKKTEVAINISDKADFNAKLVRGEDNSHYILIKGNPWRTHDNCKYTYQTTDFIKQILL